MRESNKLIVTLGPATDSEKMLRKIKQYNVEFVRVGKLYKADIETFGFEFERKE